MPHKPTTEQSAILDSIARDSSNLMIVARAGTGKSATLKMIDAADTKPPHLYLVFNRANADEALASGDFRTTTDIRTFNSIGHRVFAAAIGKKLKLNQKKINEIFRGLADAASKTDRTEMWSVYDGVVEGVNMARAIGYIPEGHANASKALAQPLDLWPLLDEMPGPLTKELIDTVLLTSIRWSYDGNIDFADQCYMPALFAGIFPKFPLILVDEYQDLSPVQHALIDKLCRHSRQIGVGDEAQAIYGFRGADGTGMDKAIAKFSMETLPLNVSFRCPSVIVENVHWRVPDFVAHRTGGSISRNATEIEDNSTVICRNNAPLLALAMKLVRCGRSVDVAGVDLSSKLVRQMRKLGPEEMNLAQTLAAIDSWQEAKEEAGSKTAADTAECMRVFARQSRSLGSAIKYCEHLFSQSGTVRFLSGHKSKGLEFDHVYHLDENLIRDSGQDPNLRYVVDTRSRDRLTYIYSEGHSHAA